MMTAIIIVAGIFLALVAHFDGYCRGYNRGFEEGLYAEQQHNKQQTNE